MDQPDPPLLYLGREHLVIAESLLTEARVSLALAGDDFEPVAHRIEAAVDAAHFARMGALRAAVPGNVAGQVPRAVRARVAALATRGLELYLLATALERRLRATTSIKPLVAELPVVSVPWTAPANDNGAARRPGRG